MVTVGLPTISWTTSLASGSDDTETPTPPVAEPCSSNVNHLGLRIDGRDRTYLVHAGTEDCRSWRYKIRWRQLGTEGWPNTSDTVGGSVNYIYVYRNNIELPSSRLANLPAGEYEFQVGRDRQDRDWYYQKTDATDDGNKLNQHVNPYQWEWDDRVVRPNHWLPSNVKRSLWKLPELPENSIQFVRMEGILNNQGESHDKMEPRNLLRWHFERGTCEWYKFEAHDGSKPVEWRYVGGKTWNHQSRFASFGRDMHVRAYCITVDEDYNETATLIRGSYTDAVAWSKDANKNGINDWAEPSPTNSD